MADLTPSEALDRIRDAFFTDDEMGEGAVADWSGEFDVVENALREAEVSRAWRIWRHWHDYREWVTT